MYLLNNKNGKAIIHLIADNYKESLSGCINFRPSQYLLLIMRLSITFPIKKMHDNGSYRQAKNYDNRIMFYHL